MNKNTSNENPRYLHLKGGWKDLEGFGEKFHKIKNLNGSFIQIGKGIETNHVLKIKCIVTIWIGEWVTIYMMGFQKTDKLT